METTINLYQKLWLASFDLCSKMDANNYKNYLLANNFYKYLSDKILDEVDYSIQEIYEKETKELEGFMEIIGGDLMDLDVLSGERLVDPNKFLNYIMIKQMIGKNFISF